MATWLVETFRWLPCNKITVINPSAFLGPFNTFYASDWRKTWNLWQFTYFPVETVTSQKIWLVSISLTGCSPCVLLLTKWDLNTRCTSWHFIKYEWQPVRIFNYIPVIKLGLLGTWIVIALRNPTAMIEHRWRAWFMLATVRDSFNNVFVCSLLGPKKQESCIFVWSNLDGHLIQLS